MASIINIKAINIQTMPVILIGTSALIIHAWGAKAKQQMLDKQMKKAVGPKVAKNPDECIQECFYGPSDDGSSPFGFPAIAFKKSAVSSARVLDGLKMTELRSGFHIRNELVPVYGNWSPREDMVRIAGGVADIRFRPEFPKWATKFDVVYNADFLTAEQIINLFHHSGFSTGVGEWRPEKSGSFGMFELGEAAQLKPFLKMTKLAAAA